MFAVATVLFMRLAGAPAAEARQNVNILIRGQSNAGIFAYVGGLRAVGAEVARLLGFVAPAQTVTLLGDGGKSMWAGVGLLRHPGSPEPAWLLPGPDPGTWTDDAHEKAFIAYLRGLPAAVKASPTVTLWLHNETDSYHLHLAQDAWESAIRYTVSAQRAALGQSPASSPVDFVFVPFDAEPPTLLAYGLAPQVQRMKAAYEDLAADAGFNAMVAAQMSDADMNETGGAFGGSHLSRQDAADLAKRLAPAIANQLARYAHPGSPAALAPGALPWAGPQAVAASYIGDNRLRLTVALDSGSHALRPLSAAAAKGVGWAIAGGPGVRYAKAAALQGGRIVLCFADPVPHGGAVRLIYGWGTGRIAEPGAAGRDAPIYDDNGLPLWTRANGIPIGN